MPFVDIKIDSSDDEDINNNNNKKSKNKINKLNRNSTLLNLSGFNNLPNTLGGGIESCEAKKQSIDRKLLPASLSLAPLSDREKNFLFKFKPKSTALKSTKKPTDQSSLSKAADLLLAQLELDVYDDDDDDDEDDDDDALDEDDDEESDNENNNNKRQLSKSMSQLNNLKLLNELNNNKMTANGGSGVDFLNSTLNTHEEQHLQSSCIDDSKLSIDRYSSIDCIDKGIVASEASATIESSSLSNAASNGVESVSSTERPSSSLKPKSDSSSHR
jgi:hypothetical protein